MTPEIVQHNAVHHHPNKVAKVAARPHNPHLGFFAFVI
jgi:hypothetical protein